MTPSRSSRGGYFGFIAVSVSMSTLLIAQLRNHFTSDGMTYHGATLVEVRSIASE